MLNQEQAEERRRRSSSDIARIDAVLEELASAIRNKDAAALVALYADDAVAFDLAPPLSISGRKLRDPAEIQTWFDTWSSPIESRPYRIEIQVGEDIAFAYGLRHMTGTKLDGEKVDLWFRATCCFVRCDGRWKILHVHNSVPFAMDGSDRALLDLQP
jgi:ketosteroid isomerase-like protein